MATSPRRRCSRGWPPMSARCLRRLSGQVDAEPVTASGALEDVRRTLRTALTAIDRGNSASAALMVESARTQLGDIDERYTAPALLAPARPARARRRRPGGARVRRTAWIGVGRG